MTEPSAATVVALRKAHDEDLRTESELDRATDITRIGPLWLGSYAERGFVTYRDLEDLVGAELDALIEAAVEHFAADPGMVSFEWKTRGMTLRSTSVCTWSRPALRRGTLRR